MYSKTLLTHQFHSFSSLLRSCTSCSSRKLKNLYNFAAVTCYCYNLNCKFLNLTSISMILYTGRGMYNFTFKTNRTEQRPQLEHSVKILARACSSTFKSNKPHSMYGQFPAMSLPRLGIHRWRSCLGVFLQKNNKLCR